MPLPYSGHHPACARATEGRVVAEGVGAWPGWPFAPWAFWWGERGLRPSLLWEQRAGLELVHLLASPVYYGVGVPRGDGAPVLLIPGFLGSDAYLLVLHGWLRRIGYRPFLAGFAMTLGPVHDLVARVVRRTDELARACGRPVTVVGHSLGGILGLSVARLRPDAVAHVVTLGSPLGEDPHRSAHPLVGALAHLLLTGAAPWRALLGSPLAPGLRLSCIYSREDAVVDFRDCVHADPRAAAYEVSGTHLGLVWNAEVYRLLGRLLAGTPATAGAVGLA